MEFIDKIKFSETTQNILNEQLQKIDLFELNWKQDIPLEFTEIRELKKVATIQSVASSTRIEGSTLSDAEVNTLIQNLTINELESRDEQEVMGYFDVLDLIIENYANITFNEGLIKQLHQMLLKHSNKDKRHRGEYKNVSNRVVATHLDGSQHIISNTTEPHLTEIEMYNLIEWTNKQLAIKEIHPILTISVFVYEFLSIHPFNDGNGRLSRLLTTLLLLQNNYSFIQYISFENQIELKKETYYKALISGQKNRNTDHEMIEEWIKYFISNLCVLTERLQQKLQLIKLGGKIYLSERHKKIIKLVDKNSPLKLSDVSKSLKTVSLASLKKDLAYLVTHEKISKRGELKATIYLPFIGR
jgi:Fic family protein